MVETKGRKILYVDDEEINLKLFDLTFKDDFKIITAISGEQGLDLLTANTDVDLIISDLRMPQMNGLEFVKEIKRLYPDKICMLLTGYVESDVILEGFNKDLIFRYITKPWKKVDVVGAIDAAFAKLKN